MSEHNPIVYLRRFAPVNEDTETRNHNPKLVQYWRTEFEKADAKWKELQRDTDLLRAELKRTLDREIDAVQESERNAHNAVVADRRWNKAEARAAAMEATLRAAQEAYNAWENRSTATLFDAMQELGARLKDLEAKRD